MLELPSWLTQAHASVSQGAKSLGAVVGISPRVVAVAEPEKAEVQSETPTHEIEAPELEVPAFPRLSDQEMEALKAETHDVAYPLMPHAPVVVAAASCEDVVLRWRGVENDSNWPIQGYVLQRFPDTKHQLEWETLLNATTTSDTTDRDVLTTYQYLYRVQAISGVARSRYAYHAVVMNQSNCYGSRTLMDYLPRVFHAIPWIGSLSIEAVQTFILITSCFLAVFSVVRSNVKRVQHTQARKGRLRKMEKSTMAETSASAPTHYTLPRLSSSEASTEPPTSVADLQMSSRSSQYEVPTPVSTPRMGDESRAASFSTPRDKSACQYCHKKFGLFRRRRVCDVCQSVTLCRKCGYQAPLDCSIDELRDSLHESPMAASPPLTKSTSLRSRRIKTICRECCDHAQRISLTGQRSTRALR